jgi:DNA polymerase III epsilon subunit-like protein
MAIENANLKEILKLNRPLVCVDLETHDMCPPDKSYIVELGLVVFYPDKPTKRWESLIRLPNGLRPHPAVVAKHGITQEKLEESNGDGNPKWPRFSDIANNLAKGMVNCDFHGYNVDQFDLKVLKASFARCGINWGYEGAFILDPLKLWRKLQTRTLTDAVREWAGREPTDAHRAGADIQDTIDVMVGMHTRLGLPTTVRECHDLCRDDEAIDAEGKFKWKGDTPVITFGKWTGTTLSVETVRCTCGDLRCKCFRGYLSWMLTGDFSAETKRVCTEALDGRFPTKESK